MGWVVITSYDKFGCDRKFLRCQAKSLFCYFVGNTIDFEDDTSGFQWNYESLGSTFTFTHTDIQRLLGDWFIGEDANPYLTLTLHVTGYCNTGCFDLTACQPDGTKGFDTE